MQLADGNPGVFYDLVKDRLGVQLWPSSIPYRFLLHQQYGVATRSRLSLIDHCYKENGKGVIKRNINFKVRLVSACQFQFTSTRWRPSFTASEFLPSLPPVWRRVSMQDCILHSY